MRIKSVLTAFLFIAWLSLGSVFTAHASTTLSLPLIVNDANSYPVPDVVYNGVTYHDFLVLDKLISGTHYYKVIYYNFVNTSSYIYASSTGISWSAQFLDGDLIASGGSLSSVGYYAQAGSGLNFAASGSLVYTSRNLYDQSGNTLMYLANSWLQSEYNSTWYTNNPFVLPGVHILFNYPSFSASEISEYQDLYAFNFDRNIADKKIYFTLTDYDLTLRRKITLQDLNGVDLDSYSSSGTGLSSGGMIEYLGAGRYVLHITDLAQFGVLYDGLDTADRVIEHTAEIVDIRFSDPIYWNSNSADVNSFCSSIPHEFSIGVSESFSWNLDTHLDDVCGLVIPPDNYLTNEFSRTKENFFGKFAFLGQISDLLNSGLTLFSGTPSAPANVDFTWNSNTYTFLNFSPIADYADDMRNYSGLIMWCTTIWIMLQIINSLFTPSQEDDLI